MLTACMRSPCSARLCFALQVLGVAVFNKYFSSWTYRSLFYFTQTLLVFVNLLDLIWVKRLNVKAGVRKQPNSTHSLIEQSRVVCQPASQPASQPATGKQPGR
jgi:hypothetical protein